jgi:hypothetical protein
MFYYRKAVNNQWKLCKITEEEATKIQSITISLCLKVLKNIKKITAEAGLKLTPDEIIATFNKVAPTFESLANDYIEKQLKEAPNSDNK